MTRLHTSRSTAAGFKRIRDLQESADREMSLCYFLPPPIKLYTRVGVDCPPDSLSSSLRRREL